METADRLQTYIALMCVLAWRLHWLTYVNRSQPDLPCTAVLITTEWQALYMFIHHTTALPDIPLPSAKRFAGLPNWVASWAVNGMVNLIYG